MNARAHIGPGSAHLFVRAQNAPPASIQSPLAHIEPDLRRHSLTQVKFGLLGIETAVGSAHCLARLRRSEGVAQFGDTVAAARV